MTQYTCPECGMHSSISCSDVITDEWTTMAVCSHCEWPVIIRISVQNPPNQDYRDKDWLEMEYTCNLRTMSEISEACGVSAMTIYHWLKRHGIPTRPRGPKRL